MFRLAALVGLVAAQHEPGTVIVGTKANFDDYIAENHNGILVEFYAPWCGHCKKLEPEFDEAAKTLFDEEIKAPLMKVDATVEESVASAYEVRGYPTLKWFVNGKGTDYDGPRKAAGIVDWIKMMTGPAVTEAAPSGDDQFHVHCETADMSKVEDVAKSNRKLTQWYYTKGDTNQCTLAHKGEEPIVLENAAEGDLEAFVTANSFPKFGRLTADTFGTYVAQGKGMVWVLPKVQDELDQWAVDILPEMLKVHQNVDTEKYNLAWVHTTEFGTVLENMFGIKPDQLPAIVVQKKIGDKASFIEFLPALEESAITSYVSKVASGEIKATLKSEPIPEEPQAEPVKIIVGDSMEKMLFRDDADVLLEVYAPWCGHCKKLDPEYNKVGRKIVKEGLDDIIVLGKMDGTLNDSPLESVSWSGFPSLFYVKAGSKKPTTFDGGRDAKAIWKWIKKNHSMQDVLKARLAAKADASPAKEEL